MTEQDALDLIAEWTDTPKLWRDMTPSEKGALLLAHHEGKVIEWNATSLRTGEWMNWTVCPSDCLWDDKMGGDGFAYRVKPEPTVETVTGSVNYINGVPDFSTWRANND